MDEARDPQTAPQNPADLPDTDETPSAAGEALSDTDLDAASERSERALSEVSETGDDLPSTGLLSFYDKLRAKIVDTVEKKGGKLGENTVKALLVVPDVFILLVRLSLDKEVPSSARMMVGGALAYFLLPMDLLPEVMVGAGGYVDDLVLATAVLAQAFSKDLEPYAEKHWSGSKSLRTVIRDVTYTAENLMGARVFNRLQKLLAKRGIQLPSDRLGGSSEHPARVV